MKILAIDTSSNICSVSILEDKNIIIEKHNDDEKTHSQKLMPLIHEMFKEVNLTLDDIDLLACSQGPGSFTGIRIGISTVKAFADVKNIPIIGVTSLESLAYNISNNGLIATLIDAKHDNVYFALYKLDNGIYTQIIEPISDSISNAMQALKAYSTPITFVGDGAIAHKDLLINEFSDCILASNTLLLGNVCSSLTSLLFLINSLSYSD